MSWCTFRRFMEYVDHRYCESNSMTQNSMNVSPAANAHPIGVRADAHSEERAGHRARGLAKLRQLLKEEFVGFHLRLVLARLLLWPLPINVGGRVRVRVLRRVGFRIGHGTVMAGTPEFSGDKHIYRNLSIGEDCWFNIHCFFDLGATITIGKNVSFGHQVIVLTNSHEIGPSTGRASTINSKPVTIGNGAWLGARVTILPGVNIGPGAVIAAGSVVHEDVPANTLVAGTPARMVRLLP
jgi:maltose O-acetyltransferase